MKQINVYKTSDGQYFEDHRKAEKHQADIIGEMFDNLLPHDDRGNVTQVDRYNLITKMMADKNLLTKIADLYKAVSHSKNED